MTSKKPLPVGGDYILGLDIGANSVGWAVLDAIWDPNDISVPLDEGGKGRWVPTAIRAAGSRIFEAAVEGDLNAGREESRNKGRRMARGARRSGDRRRRRIQRLYTTLQLAGLLPTPPPGPLTREERRDAALKALDRQLLARWQVRWKSDGASAERLAALPHVLPYALRAAGLDQRLELEEFGRALYHLGQRRGFQSNRKAPEKKDDDKGAVATSISDLQERMSAVGARTYGELFSKLNPADPSTERIRGRFTARAMFKTEFHLLWERQQREHPEVLTEALRKCVEYVIFHQRPLKSAKGLVGYCELERHRRRAPIACHEFQRFRALQKINDLRIRVKVDTQGRLTWRGGSEATARLTPDERALLLHAFEHQLDKHGNISLATIKKVLKLTKADELNFEVGEEGAKRTFPGLRTLAHFRRVFGDRWDALSPELQQQAYLDVQSIRREDVLLAVGKARYGLSDEQAKAFAALELEPDYCMLSRQALRRLLPLMEQGISYMTAREQLYGPPRPLPQSDLLLPVLDKRLGLDQELRNPVVTRGLTEVRKVVNALVREYGKPAIIRIEFARELKRSKKERMAIDKLNRENEKSRQQAINKILSEALLGATKEMISNSDIVKALLWDECSGICPYTGTPIPFRDLFSQAPRFDIEHIIPFSRSLDDSFLNKTLCLVEENRNVKKNRTPFETYGSDQERYDEILARVQRFKGDANRVRMKLDRFRATPEDVQTRYGAEFASRQLNDTRYIAKLAKRYLGQLYGCDARGIDPVTGRLVITVGQGKVTQYLRDQWHLNRILSDGGHKSRDDHRHHAVDAIAIACTDAKTMQGLQTAAGKGEAVLQRWWREKLPVPFDGFFAQAQDAIDRIIVSHRVDRKVSGPLHEETNYGPPTLVDGKQVVVRRKPVQDLKEGMLDRIVDGAVRDAVRQRWLEVGKDFRKLETQPPALINHDGTVTPIRKVRVREVANPMELATGPRKKWVLSGSNHHMEIVEYTDKKGQVKWEGHLVSLAEAYERLRKGVPIVRTDFGSGKRFVMSLATGDLIQVQLNGQVEFYRVRVAAKVGEQLTVRSVPLAEARKLSEIPTEVWLRKGPDTLRGIGCQKIELDVLGRVRPSHA